MEAEYTAEESRAIRMRDSKKQSAAFEVLNRCREGGIPLPKSKKPRNSSENTSLLSAMAASSSSSVRISSLEDAGQGNSGRIDFGGANSGKLQDY